MLLTRLYGKLRLKKKGRDKVQLRGLYSLSFFLFFSFLPSSQCGAGLELCWKKKKPCYGYSILVCMQTVVIPPPPSIGQVLFMYYVTRVGPHKKSESGKKTGIFLLMIIGWIDFAGREGVPAFGGREGVEVGKSRLVCFLLFYLFSLRTIFYCDEFFN